MGAARLAGQQAARRLFYDASHAKRSSTGRRGPTRRWWHGPRCASLSRFGFLQRGLPCKRCACYKRGAGRAPPGALDALLGAWAEFTMLLTRCACQCWGASPTKILHAQPCWRWDTYRREVRTAVAANFGDVTL